MVKDVFVFATATILDNILDGTVAAAAIAMVIFAIYIVESCCICHEDSSQYGMMMITICTSLNHDYLSK